MRLNPYAEHLIRAAGLLVSYEREDEGDGVLTPEYSSDLILSSALVAMDALMPLMGAPFSSAFSVISTERDEQRRRNYVEVNDDAVGNLSVRYTLIAVTAFIVDAIRNHLGQTSMIKLPTGEERRAILVSAADLADESKVKNALFSELINRDRPVPNKKEISKQEAEQVSDAFLQALRRR